MAIFDRSETKKAYQYDAKGVFLKEIELTWMNRSPISGTWQIPAFVTTTKPVAEKEGFKRVFDGKAWGYADADDDSKKPETAPEPTVTTLKERVAALETENAELKTSKEAMMAQIAETQDALNVLLETDDMATEETK